MADRPRFGPAGRPLVYEGPTIDVPRFIHIEGLDAFEYEAVRGVHITQSEAKELGVNARNSDVWLTLHGPYFINLCGTSDVVEKSKARILDSLKAASWMHAHVVVFHPGYYMKNSKAEALRSCIQAIKEIIEDAESLGIRDVKLGPETAGKQTQFGSVEEIIEICEKLDRVTPTIDWAHIHAREGGRIRDKNDYLKLMEAIEMHLGKEAIKNLHSHFAHIEFTAKGERRHHTLYEREYGPPFEPLAEVIAEQKLNPVIISESPVLDIDSLRMRDMVLKAFKGEPNSVSN